MGVLEIDQRLNTIMESAPTNLTIEKPVASDVHKKCSGSVEEMHVEFTKSLEIDNSNSENSNASKQPLPVGETKIQLSFSVDRLLNIEEPHSNGRSSANVSHEVCESGKNCNSSEVKCFDGANMCAYGSCTDPNCAALLGGAPTDMQLDNVSRNLKKYSISALTNEMQEKFYRQIPSLAPPYLDFKAIVRPTPIRMVNNAREAVQLHTPYSTMATTALLRFQQQQQKSAATHAQMLVNTPGILQNLGGTGAVSLGLKSFHNPTLNMPNFAPPTLSVRFPTLKTHAHHLLDIPMSTANLMNHHRQHHPHHVTQTTDLTTSSHAAGSNTSTQLQLATASGSNGSMNNSNNNGSGGGVGGSSGGGKRKRSWSRAVFSNLQRKGLEIQFQQQKYITKPDRRKLAARLNLTDAQVKVWFQNRRMKWRHTRENLKSGQEKQIPSATTTGATSNHKQEGNAQVVAEEKNGMDGYSSDDSSCGELSENEDEIDVVQ
ncbi:homeobox protein H2.0 [Zeugodacus cucurbitae]|uniref:homeobox protein H2.0 n=1 Tax=Zeugodacus cucurbitae TaxID=28588 RepID=UPI0023D9110E|nr:homeobox protein H2.0 [Zeugodacus cucurbitae]